MLQGRKLQNKGTFYSTLLKMQTKNNHCKLLKSENISVFFHCSVISRNHTQNSSLPANLITGKSVQKGFFLRFSKQQIIPQSLKMLKNKYTLWLNAVLIYTLGFQAFSSLDRPTVYHRVCETHLCKSRSILPDPSRAVFRAILFFIKLL